MFFFSAFLNEEHSESICYHLLLQEPVEAI